ncbi:MAG: 50S ribosomal protein L1 [Candidatus Absconditabacteria bacterium]|nr:50S ribosomal protein L1 [Candidatus Absconditabacteria bacterium]MDD3868177.1 50S ribosomal protein L1 [Candidatus Absconditabacteria bacterium]MDD4714564.1 50S ribosomal protein L1 [Candidatus Absconditabacteria bacterium]
MAKHGKKYNEAKKSLETLKLYSLEEAVGLAKKTNYVKFDATLNIAIKTNANPKYNDQMIRATTILPHGTGKTKKVAVFVSEDKVAEAKSAGADIAGFETLLNDIKAGKMDFDVLITTPDHIRDLAPVAKQLGPKGLMPSPKAGTVAADITQAVEEVKKGKIEFRLDKTGNIHAGVGKLSFDEKKLVENVEALLKAIEDNKPSGVKGKLIKKIVLSSTMSPAINVIA